MSLMLDGLGWLATGIFAGSYFFRQPTLTSRVQALAAMVWIGYGALLPSPPIVVANLIVALLAGYSSWRDRGSSTVT